MGADYICLSPVAATPSHPDAAVIGWENFSQLIESVAVPVFALGGMGEKIYRKQLLRVRRGLQGLESGGTGDKTPSAFEMPNQFVKILQIDHSSVNSLTSPASLKRSIYVVTTMDCSISHHTQSFIKIFQQQFLS